MSTIGGHGGNKKPGWVSIDLNAKQPATAVGSTSIPRVGESDRSSFDGLIRGRGEPTKKRARRHQAGAEASSAGFGLMQRLGRASRKQLVAGAIGFALLLPPVAGQLVNPGGSLKAAKSPVAMQIMEMKDVGTGAQILDEARATQARVPGGIEERRQFWVRALIDISRDADSRALDAGDLYSEASQTLAQLREEVGLDARAGYLVDLYWFGVPDNHKVFHKGGADADAMSSQTEGLRSAASEIRQMARDEVSGLLAEESTDYRALRAEYDLEHSKLTASQNIVGLATTAADEISSAENYIMLRNMTPKTVSVSQYETRTSTDSEGNVTSERVYVGESQEPNPAWDTYNVLAIAAKANAESAVRELNGAIKASAELLRDAGLSDVDSGLLGVFDVIGHPSFAIWSFDSVEADNVKSDVLEVRSEIQAYIREMKPHHDELESNVNAQIDARWSSLLASR